LYHRNQVGHSIKVKRKTHAWIAELKKEIETIVAHSKEQDSQIQKVRNQVQRSSPETRLASYDHQ